MTNQTIYIRHKNQTAKAVIVKHNRVRAKVRLEENFMRWGVGKVISCPYEFMHDVNGAKLFTHDGQPWTCMHAMARQVQREAPLPVEKFVPTELWVSQHVGILEVLAGVHTHLSPENLTCDGEASRAWVNKRRNELNKKLEACFVLLGHEFDAYQLYQIEGKFKDQFKKHHEQALKYINV